MVINLLGKWLHLDKFLDLVNLVLTSTWYTFSCQFYQQTGGVTMGGPGSSITVEIYMQAHERTAISTALHLDDVYSILKRPHLEKLFHHINKLHQNIKFTMDKESNGELAFLDTLLKRNDGKISVLVYRKSTHTDQYIHYSSHHETNCNENVVSSLLNRAYSIVTKTDDLHKENARINQMLKENGCQKSIISKIFKRINDNYGQHNNN